MYSAWLQSFNHSWIISRLRSYAQDVSPWCLVMLVDMLIANQPLYSSGIALIAHSRNMIERTTHPFQAIVPC